MPATSKVITRDMMRVASENGWTISETARQYDKHRSSVSKACDRFGIVLPMHNFSPQKVSVKSRVWIDLIDNEKRPKVKLSASPAAIRRAIADMEREKRLMARS